MTNHSSPVTASTLLTEIIAYFSTSKENPGDAWAHPDDFSSYGLDYRSRDGTKLWIDLEQEGTIMVLWKPSSQERPTIQRFVAQSTRDAVIEECAKVADGVAEWFGEHQSFLAEDAVDDCARKIRALSTVTSTQAPAQCVPDGWRLVPYEPTQDMLDTVTSSEGYEPWTDNIMRKTYQEMLDAAPAVTSTDGGGK